MADVLAPPDPRRRVAELEAEVEALRGALARAWRETEERLRSALDGAGVGTWGLDLRSGVGVWSARMAEMHGVAAGAVPTHAEWLARIHPEDRPAMHGALAAALAGEAPHYEAAYRYSRPDGAVPWVWVRGAVAARDPGTGAALSIAGVSRDDTERGEAEARRDLLAREVDHRAKNALAVVQSVLRLTKADDPRGYARAVEGRIAALARAHNLLARNTWAGASLRAILAQELAPYLAGNDGAAPRGRALLDGLPVTLAPAAAQPLSMALHELATNAAKYGALSVPEGRVVVAWWVEPAGGALRLRWTERGGPGVAGRPARRGFGSRVLEGTVRSQLGGLTRTLWEPEGLVCEMHLPARHVAGGGDCSCGDGERSHG